MTDVIPHFDQYWGPWACLPDALRQAADRLQGVDVAGHLAIAGVAPASRSRFGSDSFSRIGTGGGVALVQLIGPLTKYGASFGGTSTIDARRQIRQAVQDETVQAILLAVESPGGTSAGTKELADDVAKAAAVKPTVAYIEDLGASAAYWVASQANKLYANAPAMIGSIGTYAVVEDSSELASKIGVRVLILKAGEFKGAGEPGSEVTESQLAEWQRLVNDINEFFVQAVAKGRRLSIDRARGQADGRLHVAGDAQKLGLIDGVASFEETLRRLESEPASQTPSSSRPGTRKDLPMSDTPASLQELRAALPGASDTFILQQLERGASVIDAQRELLALQQRELARTNQAESRRPGAEPLREGHLRPGAGGGGGDPVAEFHSLVRERMREGHLDRRQAVLAVCRERPDLHEAFVSSTNPAHQRVQDLIHERFTL